MAYVPGFEYDILVSFAAADDQSAAGMPHGWVATLVEHLRWRLSQWLGGGDRYALWYAGRAARVQAMDPREEDRVRNAAILLVIHSAEYESSRWCQAEMELFRRSANSTPSTLGSRRVFVVELEALAPGTATLAATGERGYRFWNWTDKGPARLTPSPGGLTAVDYFDQLEQLVRDLRADLKRMRSGKPDSPREEDARLAVYLAETIPDQAARRDEAARYLEQAGWRVLPERPLPGQGDEYQSRLARDMQQAVLFVQLLGATSAGAFPGTAASPISMQLAAAVTAGRRRLQWRAPRSSEPLARESRLGGPAVLEVGFEEFKSLIVEAAHHELDRLTQPELDGVTPTERLVCVQRHPDDQALADDVGRRLTAAGCVCSQPLIDGRPEELRQDLEANLFDCDALVIVCDACPVSWVWQQLRNWRRARFQREKPFRDPFLWWRGATIEGALAQAVPHTWLIDDRVALEGSAVAAIVAQMFRDEVELK